MTNKLKRCFRKWRQRPSLIFDPFSNEEDKIILFFGQSKVIESNNLRGFSRIMQANAQPAGELFSVGKEVVP